MPTFELQDAQGKSYEVEAPDEGSAVAAFKKMGTPFPSAMDDINKTLPAALARGGMAVLGLPGDLKNLTDRGTDYLMGKFGLAPHDPPADSTAAALESLSPPSSGELTKALEQNVTGPLYKPQTPAGKYVNAGAEFLPSALFGGGGSLAGRGIRAMTAGLGSEAAGQAAEGTEYETAARLAGAMIGGTAPSFGRRIVTPFSSSPERQAAVATLRAAGVQPTAGQATGNKRLQYFESEMGGGAAANAMDRQADQFTHAALEHVGENANRATPEVVDRAFNRIGQAFDDVESRNTLVPDVQLGPDLVGHYRDYAQSVGESSRAPVVQNTIADIATAIRDNGGSLPGSVYQDFRSRIGTLARKTQDPQLSQALHGIRESLDDGMERSMTAAGNTADVTAWREARNQYRNMLVIEKTATAAGGNAAMGAITPANLRNATKTVQGLRNYARGHGDFAELARSGESILTPLPNSGTPGRLAARGFASLPAIAGAALGGHLGGAEGGGLGVMLGAAAPAVMGRAAMSAPIQAYLANQLLQGGQSVSQSAARAALAEMLVNGRISDASR